MKVFECFSGVYKIIDLLLLFEKNSKKALHPNNGTRE